MTPKNKITVEKYNPQWAGWFDTIRQQIWPHIADRAIRIEHVGSTSIPDLAAKPIIDIDIVIEDSRKFHGVMMALESLGYEHRGNLGIEGRESFRVPGDHPIKHNLYVCVVGCLALRNHLQLREHLRKNKQDRDTYSDLKFKLSDSVSGIEEYIEGKTAFIVRILRQYNNDASELDAIASANAASDHRLVVRSAEQVAELWDKDRIIRTYKISTALKGLSCTENTNCTPFGKLRIASKIGCGLPVGAVLKGRIPTGEVWSSEPNNPLNQSTEDLVLTRLLWLEGAEPHNANTFKRFIYLHGTNQESLLGQPASHGCIRFSNADILEVFDRLQAGNEVEVI